MAMDRRRILGIVGLLGAAITEKICFSLVAASSR